MHVESLNNGVVCENVVHRKRFELYGKSVNYNLLLITQTKRGAQSENEIAIHFIHAERSTPPADPMGGTTRRLSDSQLSVYFTILLL